MCQQQCSKVRERQVPEDPGWFSQLPSLPMAVKPTRPTQRADPVQPNLLPWEADAHGEHSDAPLLELFGGQGHVPLGPSISDDDEDLGHRGISAPWESFVQKVFQSKVCLCAPSSEFTQKEKKKRRKSQRSRGEVGMRT